MKEVSMELPKKIINRRLKKNLKEDVLLSISKCYKPESFVYKRVSKALDKFTLQELDNLIVMIMTSK